MDINKIKNNITKYQETVNEILKFINYGGNEHYEIEILDNVKWNINLDELLIEFDDDIYLYSISSYSAMGEQLYYKKDSTHTYIMAYVESENWDDAQIFILKNKNIDETLSIY